MKVFLHQTFYEVSVLDLHVALFPLVADVGSSTHTLFAKRILRTAVSIASCCAGQDGPSFWAQTQTDCAIKIVDKAPSKVLRRLKEQLDAASGTQLSGPALYGQGGGQHSMKAYLQKYCTPIPAVSATDITQWFKPLQQESLHRQWSILRLADDKLELHLLRDGCSMRVRLEESVLHTEPLVRGAFHSMDLSYMGVPKQLFSQADLSELLQLLEQACMCAGASAACMGKYESILGEKRQYLDQQGHICGQLVTYDILTRDGLFHSTVRSTACSQLVPPGTLLCKPCKRLQRSQLDSSLRRSKARLQAGQHQTRARPQTETHEHAAERARQARARVKNSKRRQARLRRKLLDLRSESCGAGSPTTDNLPQLLNATGMRCPGQPPKDPIKLFADQVHAACDRRVETSEKGTTFF